MKQFTRIYDYIITSALLVALGLVITGCDGSSDIIEPPATDGYTIQGVFVQNVNVTTAYPDFNHIAIGMTKNDDPFTTGQLFFWTSPLAFDTSSHVTDSVYTFTNTPRSYLTPQNYAINIIDSTTFADTLLVTVLDTFRITNYNPDSTTTYNSNDNGVTIEWTSAPNISGYVVGVIPADSAYKGQGYSSFVTSQTTSAFIPQDAFRNPTDTTQLLTGMYHIFVYGYTGAPDSGFAHRMLPTPFPAQLSDNVNHPDLKGHFGSITVCRRVPLEVVAN